MKSQLDWDIFYLKVADLIAQQSYAEDRKVGALIVKDGNIISFSYNGTPPAVLLGLLCIAPSVLALIALNLFLVLELSE